MGSGGANVEACLGGLWRGSGDFVKIFVDVGCGLCHSRFCEAGEAGGASWVLGLAGGHIPCAVL